MVADAFHAFDLAWQLRQSHEQADRNPDIGSDLDAGTAQILLDGKVVERGRMALPDLAGSEWIAVGIGHYYWHQNYFGGLIDDVRIYESTADYLLDVATRDTAG